MKTSLCLAVFSSFSALALSSPAQAQSSSPFAGIWTLQDENASVSTSQPTDRYYVNGFHLGWTSPEGKVPDFLADFGHALLGEGTQRISVGVVQQLYTPNDTKLTNPNPNDEPYAGYLAATVSLIQDTPNTRTVLGMSAGVIGRDAGGEIVQNGFHSVISQNGTHGWAYQLPSEPAIDFSAARIWRVPVTHLSNGMEADMLPQISAMGGLTEDYVQPALGFRFGQGLDADFGPSLLATAPSGADAFNQTQPVVWYVFGSAAAKVVGHDEILQGADFQSSRGVDPYRVVGTFEAGATVIWRGVRFTYTQVFQTNRFYHQEGTIHGYGSFSLGFTF
ncbi:lipid A deacylase LpxR family protein [Acidocella aromatica]|uniref:lipid A deacylase LpxR family protein n=1 Tax=Acidocella aromatica TaxID=1303579 RepID=UPI001606ACD8|nr:lipid A deacylase LpxR family protein [Acidocella aromatica]